MTKLLVIVGPTNIGKTAFAVELARQFNGEIISADSRQVYREMSIGTAKPTPAEQAQAKHYLVDIVNPDESFTLADWQQQAYEAIDEIVASGKHPILVGGTGLYIQAVVDGLKIPKVKPDHQLRAELEALPTEDLVKRLDRLDPDSAKAITSQNRRRLTRAIEVTETLGQPFSILGRQFHRQFDVLEIGLTAPRDELYRRADAGVDQWIRDGWVDEVRRLKKKYPPTLPSMSSIGYQQIGMFLDGKLSLEDAVQRVKFARHNYIRRQLIWFRHNPRIHWHDTSASGWKEDVVKQIKSWYAGVNV